MTHDEIRAAIAARADLAPLVQARNDTAIAAALSEGRTKVVSRLMSERGILDLYPGGAVQADALLTRLENFAATPHPLASIVARALRFLRQPEGIDLGAPATAVMLDALEQGQVITPTERQHLRAMVLVADPVPVGAVSDALNEV